MGLVAGIDSSTQSCKVVVRDADDGTLIRSGRADHPAGTEIDPREWLRAMDAAIGAAGGLDDVDAVAVGAQQHGMICLDETGNPVRDALLWNDTRSAPAANDLIDELGGAAAWAERIGVVPVASITATKLRWLADNEPRHADATAAVCLPHDWLTWRLRGSTDIADLTTDRSDASGTGYFSAVSGDYDHDLLSMALRGRTPMLPAVLGPHDSPGDTRGGARLGAGAGDNASAALALDAQPGDVIVSLGTSGVVSAVTDVGSHDADGYVAGFADATGRQLPLVCTLNGAPVLASIARMLGVDLDTFADLALSAQPGSGGASLIPYFEGERSPNLPDARATLAGLSVANSTPATIARAAVEGLLCSLADGLGFIVAQGVRAQRVILVGGGVRSRAVREIAPAVFGLPVLVPEPGEYVADGAARQAAWALTGADAPPRWALSTTERFEAEHAPAILEQYRAAQAQTYR
ncbi:xylulose kinase [Williamsia sp. Leaf354]|uniref:xylulokinase n=1 Tax=Williamsia sp. Leaf354 TaxID=1736349 RepID=UPI0006F66675|nr:FGGY family carbohydrate kinase [Williamsia sp. Leaf354]KQR97799.1 xylulose kinase [Williamsia sp. Leaf354]